MATKQECNKHNHLRKNIRFSKIWTSLVHLVTIDKIEKSVSEKRIQDYKNEQLVDIARRTADIHRILSRHLL